jgi:hypothetical protein
MGVLLRGIIFRGRRYAWYNTYQNKKDADAGAKNLRSEGWLVQIRKKPETKYFSRWAVYYTPRKGWIIPGQKTRVKGG